MRFVAARQNYLNLPGRIAARFVLGEAFQQG
jgi:hypothetical protein